MSFSWNDFFARWGRYLNPNATFPNEWLENLGSSPNATAGEKRSKTCRLNREIYPQALLCVRFLALAFWDSKRIAACNLETMSALAQELGFEFTDFANNEAPKTLRRQLKQFSIELLRSPNGNNQYLRTLQILSGKTYPMFASAVANAIRGSSWEKCIEEGTLEDNAEFKRIATRYQIPEESTPSNDNISLKDIADFFRKLIRLHIERGTEFTISDIQRFASVTDTVASDIINNLNQNNENLAFAETGPVIGLDTDGKGVYLFPESGKFSSETKNLVVFRIKKDPTDSDINCLSIRYTQLPNKTWRRELSPQCPQNGFPMDTYHAIDLICRNKERVLESKLPLICQQQDHLLVRVRKDNNGCIVLDKDKKAPYVIQSANDKLTAEASYKILPLTASPITEYTVQTQNEEQRVETLSDDGIFTIPSDAESIIISGLSYLCKTSWLDLADAIDWVEDKDHSRKYFVSNQCPVLWEKLYSDEVCRTIKYNFDESEYLLFENGNWKVPDNCLWKKGWGVLYRGSDILIRRKITFVSEIDWCEVDNAVVPIGESREFSIKIDENEIKGKLGADDDFVTFEYKGFKIKRFVEREGIAFQYGKRDPKRIIIKPEPNALDPQVGFERVIQEVANDDFQKMGCMFHFPELEKSAQIKLYHENKSISWRSDRPTFNFFKEISKSEQLTRFVSDYYAICVPRKNVDEFYKFHVYHPEHDPVAADKVENDLVCKISCAKTNFSEEKYLCFVPAHKQDGKFQSIAMEQTEVTEYDEDDGKGKVTLKISGFYANCTEYGHGLICFIAKRGASNAWEVLTPGFFIGMTGSEHYEDDPYELRRALAEKDQGRIVEIMMQRGDREFTGYITDFIRKMTKCVTPLNAFRYMNCYYNCVADAKTEYSGYIFMCNAFFQEISGENIANIEQVPEWENYKQYWDPKMFGYSVLTPSEPKLPEAWEDKVVEAFSSLPFEDQKWIFEKFQDRQGRQVARDCLTIETPLQLSLAQILGILYWFSYQEEIPNRHISCLLSKDQRDRYNNKTDYRNVIDFFEELRRKALRWCNGDLTQINVDQFSSDIEQIRQDQNKYLKNFEQLFKKQIAENPFFYFSGWRNDNANQQVFQTEPFHRERRDLIGVFETIGNKLHEWRRKEPNLGDAQSLRNNLLRLREIDARQLLINPQAIRFRDIVEWYAYKAYKAYQTSLKKTENLDQEE